MSIIYLRIIYFTYANELVNEAQLLNITFLLALSAAAPVVAVFGIIIVPLTCMMHLYNHINLALLLKF